MAEMLLVAWSVESLVSNSAARVRFPNEVRNFSFYSVIGYVSFVFCVVSGVGTNIVQYIQGPLLCSGPLSVASPTGS